MTSFAKLMPEIKTSDIDCGWGITARMTYKPRQITYTVEEAQDEAAENDDDQERRNRLADELCRVVTEWDMTGPIPIEDLPRHKVGSVLAEDEPVPLESRILSFLPQPLLAGIVLGLTIDAQPDPKAYQSRLQKRGAIQHSGKQNGVTDTSILSPIGSTTS